MEFKKSFHLGGRRGSSLTARKASVNALEVCSKQNSPVFSSTGAESARLFSLEMELKCLDSDVRHVT